jgi:hypothetical protein
LSAEQNWEEIGEGPGQTDVILSRFLIDISGIKIRSEMQIGWSYHRFHKRFDHPNILCVLIFKKAWILTVNPRFPFDKSESILIAGVFTRPFLPHLSFFGLFWQDHNAPSKILIHIHDGI